MQHGQLLRHETAHALAAEDPKHATRYLEGPMRAPLRCRDPRPLEGRLDIRDDRVVLPRLHGDRDMGGLAATHRRRQP